MIDIGDEAVAEVEPYLLDPKWSVGPLSEEGVPRERHTIHIACTARKAKIANSILAHSDGAVPVIE